MRGVLLGWAFAALGLILNGCGGGGSPAPKPVPAVNTIDVRSYLTTASRCADGTLAVLSGCVGMPQRASDPLLYRMADRSGHVDGQIEDAFVADAGNFFVNTFSYPPNGPFVAAHGDGGDVMVTDGATIRIAYTQNGTPGGGTIAGYWGGAGCFFGTGWLLFDDATPTGSWAARVAYLGGVSAPNTCPQAFSTAYTRWRAETAPVVFVLPSGAQQSVVLPIVISEHYDASTIAGSINMERFIMARGVGRIAWQAFSTTGPGASFVDPGMAPWTDAPAGFYLKDERLLTAVVPGNGMTGAAIGWPGSGFVP